MQVQFIAVRKSNCGKVMFSQASHFVHGVGVGGEHGRTDGHSSGRYAPYWNKFLFVSCLI